MLQILVVSVCLTTPQADGRLRVLCRADFTDPMRAEDCARRKEEAANALKGDPRLRVFVECRGVREEGV